MPDGWEGAARSAGWAPPDEVWLKVWHARNLNGDSCRWCHARRLGPDVRPHRPSCRFYDGPVTHGFANGHLGTFDFWIYCTCGRNYPQHDAEGNEQDCPDRDLTWRHPKEPDLTAATQHQGGDA